MLPVPILSHHEIRATQVYTKLEEWSFEKEYRTMTFWEWPATKDQRRRQLPKEAFNCVILGKDISEKNRNEVIEAVKNNIGDIPILNHNNVR